MQPSTKITAFLGRLKPGYEEAYKKWHDDIPDDVVALYRKYGIQEIRLFRNGLDLVMLIMTEPEFDLEAATIAAMKEPLMAAWVGHTTPMFECDGDWPWRPLSCFFELPE